MEEAQTQYNNYLKYVNEYNSLLKIRNDYLKRLNINGNTDLRYLDIIPTDLKEVEKPIKKNSKKEIKEIDNLTNYELKFEYLATKKNHKYKMCRILKKEILERGIKGAGKKKKIIEKLKGEIEND